MTSRLYPRIRLALQPQAEPAAAELPVPPQPTPRLSLVSRSEPDIEAQAQHAYNELTLARRAAGLARISIGLQLVLLKGADAWQGRTGARSFQGFLREEGIEPQAARQYMTVARCLVLDYGVDPKRISLVSMRVLVAACQRIRGQSESGADDSNVEELLDIITSLPSAEAMEAMKERFDLNADARSALLREKRSAPVARILDGVATLTFEQRAELFAALAPSPAPSPSRRRG